jgi:hypothetical protein
MNCFQRNNNAAPPPPPEPHGFRHGERGLPHTNLSGGSLLSLDRSPE